MTGNRSLPRLVSLACHDLRTPLATVYGFARTLTRTTLGDPQSRYVRMIEAASAEMSDLLDELALVARIESGRFEPALADVDSLELARSAGAEVADVDVAVRGEGETVRVDSNATSRAIARLVRAAGRHGGVDSLELTVRGSVLEVAPVTATAARVVTGDELRELSPAAAVALVEALGGLLELEGDRLLIRLPTP